jgi:hypothetical protein
MKKLIYLLFFISLDIGAQYNPVRNILLDEWSFTKDTTISIQTTHAYNSTIALECGNLTGTLDGTFGIKIKMNGLDNWIYVTSDTSSSPGTCKKLIDEDYKTIYFTYDWIRADSLRFELRHNSITGGPVSLIIKRY